MDAAGNVTITDRLKDMYVVGGFNAYPAEIEAILRGHDGRGPGRGRSACPTSGWARSGCAYVVPAAGAADDATTPTSWDAPSSAGPASAMANYKVPRGVVLVDALPVNASGKVLKRELRRRHAAGADRIPTSRDQREEQARCEASSTPVKRSRSPTSSRCAAPGPTRCRCAMRAAGVCHSDLSVIDGTIPFPAPGGARPRGRRRRRGGR